MRLGWTFKRHYRRLHPVMHLELLKDVGNIMLHRFFGQVQLQADLLVAGAGGDQFQYFLFTFG